MLLLVGGVNFHSKQPGLCIVDLNKLKAVEFELPVMICFYNALIFDSFLFYFKGTNK
jgi:hypothetical protein